MLRIVDVAEILRVSQQRVHQIYKPGRPPEPARRDPDRPALGEGHLEKWATAEWWAKSRTPWRRGKQGKASCYSARVENETSQSSSW
jgi:hypothetical protein